MSPAAKRRRLPGNQGLWGWGGPPSPVTPQPVPGFLVLVGDSNMVGQGDTSHMDDGLDIQNPYSGATMAARYATSVTNPMAWIVEARAPLQPQAPPGSPGVGPDLSLGRYLVQYGGLPVPVLFKMAANGAEMAHFTPGSTSPNNPKNLFGQLTDEIDGQLVAGYAPLVGVVTALGTNDASDNTLTSAYAANLMAYDAALRARYGPAFLHVLVRVNVNMTAEPSGNIATVNSAMDALAASSPGNTIAVVTDRIPVSNSHLHYVADEQISLGNLLGEAISQALAPGRNTNYLKATGPAPWLQSYNEPTVRASTSTGDLTIRGPAWSNIGDWEYLLVGTGFSNVAPALTTAAGFTPVAGAQGFSLSSTVYQFGYLYERLVTVAGHQPDPVLADNNATKQACIFSVRGAYQGASAVEAVTLTPNNAVTTGQSANGVTTLGANRLVLHLQAAFSSSPNKGSGWADATLAGFSLVRDSTDDTNETSSIAAGTLAAAGPTGTVTGTRVGDTLAENLVIAIRPP